MLVSGVLAGLILGLAVGRRPERLGRLKIRWLPLLVIAVAGRAVAPLFVAVALPLYLLAIGVTGLVASVNGRLPGAIAIALGSASNFAVVALNRGMPVDAAALARAGGHAPADLLHTTLSDQTALPVLADVLIVPPFGAYSAGDVAIALGAFLLAFLTLARP